jgi:hypothetical protein
VRTGHFYPGGGLAREPRILRQPYDIADIMTFSPAQHLPTAKAAVAAEDDFRLSDAFEERQTELRHLFTEDDSDDNIYYMPRDWSPATKPRPGKHLARDQAPIRPTQKTNPVDRQQRRCFQSAQ